MICPRAKREVSSATLTQTLALIAGCSGLFVLTASGTNPSWWSSPGTGSLPPVMTPRVVTNSGVVTTNYVPNDYAIATQGQLKQFTARAVDELNAKLTNSGGAGPALSNLVYGWGQDYATNNYNSATNTLAPYNPRDFTAINVGQLKYIAHLIYGQLSSAGYGELTPTWIHVGTNDDAAANLGQLKEVFDFDLNLGGPSNLTASSNNSGTIDLSWTNPTNSPATAYLVEQQNVDGSWSVIATLSNSATSFAVTNLSAGENPEFQIIAQAGKNVSMAQTTPGDPDLIAPSNVYGTPGTNAGEVDVSWQNNATDATYVIVNQSPDGVNWTPIATLPPTATFYAVTNLTPGQAYYFGVSAGNN
jgi:hypothetical protein